MSESRTTTQAAAEEPKKSAMNIKGHRPSKFRILMLLVPLIACLGLVMFILVVPAAAASWVDSETQAGMSQLGDVPVSLFKLVPFFIKIYSKTDAASTSYFYAATNQCAHMAVGGFKGVGRATCSSEGMLNVLSDNSTASSISGGMLRDFESYYKTKVATTTTGLLSVGQSLLSRHLFEGTADSRECCILFAIICISVIALVRDAQLSQLRRKLDANPKDSKAHGAYKAAKQKAQSSALLTNSIWISTLHGLGNLFLFVCIILIGTARDRQLPKGTETSLQWGFYLIILATILHLTCVGVPLWASWRQKKRASPDVAA